MLCQFLFQNYRSYKNAATFDFRAAPIPEFSDSLIQREKCADILPVGAIYGPNGGGKSNLLSALSCLISTVVKPILMLNKNRSDLILQHEISCEPFLFDAQTAAEPTLFQILFRTENYEYRYILSLKEDEVVAEALDRKKLGGTRSACIFDRDGAEISLGSILKREKVNTNANPKMAFLSFLAINYNIPVITEVQSWFESCMIRNYANPVVEKSIMFFDNDNPAGKKQIVRLLNAVDIDISDYRYDEALEQLILKRRINGQEYELPFDHESDGTKKLIAFLPVFLIALSEGRLLVVDELDAKLHPKLLRYIISLFQNPEFNRHGAQLLFTSHDMATMKNTVFRRDEIWFAALDDEHSSEIYSLYDIRRPDNERVNHTAAFDKQYLEGRYGADPYLQNILSGGDWDEQKAAEKK